MPRKSKRDAKVDYWSLEPEFRAWLEERIERSRALALEALVSRALAYSEEAKRSDPAHAARASSRERDLIQAAEDLVEARHARRNFSREDEDFYRRSWEAAKERAAKG